MESDPEKKAIMDLIALHAAQIGEHVDSVQIFVTKQRDDDGTRDTMGCDCGLGNFYARMGQVGEWIESQREYNREYSRIQQRRMMSGNPPPTDEE
jgi:hypothetical protein